MEDHYSNVQLENHSHGSDTASDSLSLVHRNVSDRESHIATEQMLPTCLKDEIEDDQGTRGVVCLTRNLMLACKYCLLAISLGEGEVEKEGGERKGREKRR